MIDRWAYKGKRHNKILMNINESGCLEYKNLWPNHNLNQLEFRILEDCQTFDHVQSKMFTNKTLIQST